jgi:enoyl-CoA hydratase/carnithine racemase
VPAQELEAEALAQAKALGKLPAAAYAQVKQALMSPARLDGEALWTSCREEISAMLETSDVQEGLSAMRDKRRPRWEKADV